MLRMRSAPPITANEFSAIPSACGSAGFSSILPVPIFHFTEIATHMAVNETHWINNQLQPRTAALALPVWPFSRIEQRLNRLHLEAIDLEVKPVKPPHKSR